MTLKQPDEKDSPQDAEPPNLHLWRVAGSICVILLLVAFGEIYLRMAVGVAIFSLFIPRKAWPQIAPLLALLALCGVPTLLGGIKLANFLILSCLYGLEPVLSGAVRITGDRTFIKLSNGDEFHDLRLFLWRAATFVLIAVVGLIWLRTVTAISKRLCPSFHIFLDQLWSRMKSSSARRPPT